MLGVPPLPLDFARGPAGRFFYGLSLREPVPILLISVFASFVDPRLIASLPFGYFPPSPLTRNQTEIKFFPSSYGRPIRSPPQFFNQAPTILNSTIIPEFQIHKQADREADDYVLSTPWCSSTRRRYPHNDLSRIFERSVGYDKMQRVGPGPGGFLAHGNEFDTGLWYDLPLTVP
jgi:hypothetical protein